MRGKNIDYIIVWIINIWMTWNYEIIMKILWLLMFGFMSRIILKNVKNDSHMRVLIDKNMIIVLHILDFTLDLYLSKIYYEEILK